jgi:dUTP pyrophosphatase
MNDIYFEKISFQQFKKDISDSKKLYNDYLLPSRATKSSAGYDFKAIEKVILEPGQIKKIPTGIKAKYPENYMLMIVVRSSMGFKYNIRLTNQIGIIDSDYYNNVKNEGHIWISLMNEGTETFVIEKNDSFSQGIFTTYFTVKDDTNAAARVGGLGSTNVGE